MIRDFFQLNPYGNSPHVTSPLTRRWVCLLWICLAFRQVYVSHIYSVIENSPICNTYKSSVSPGFSEQIMPILRVICYNGSLVTWTVVNLTTAKFKTYIFLFTPFQSYWHGPRRKHRSSVAVQFCGEIVAFVCWQSRYLTAAVVCSSETSVNFYQTVRCHIPDDFTLCHCYVLCVPFLINSKK
jgi:hypothetical protein